MAMNRFLALAAVAVLSACGGGGGGSDSSGEPPVATPDPVTGVFVDARVSGLGVVTPLTGDDGAVLTDALGRFDYTPGDSVDFVIGDIALGGATGAAVLTPVDLVPGATGADLFADPPAVLNIIRLMLTLDADFDASNGIAITPQARQVGQGRSLNFDQSFEAFGEDAAVLDYIAAATNDAAGRKASRSLVSAEAAAEHFEGTQADLADGSPNLPPTVTASGPATAEAGADVVLTAASDDADGSVAAHAWAQTDGPAVALTGVDTPTAGFTAPTLEADAELRFRVTVVDDTGASATDTVTLTVTAADLAGNTPPTADAGADQTVDEQTAVTLDGSGSSDAESDVTYAWRETSGNGITLTGADTATPGFTAPATTVAATLTFELTVSDALGAAATDSVDVTVQPVNAAPVANAGGDQAVDEQTTVTLDASASSDADGSLVSIAWSQTDGSPVTLADADTAVASFTAPATADALSLGFAVTVTDNEGASATDAVTVTVRPVNAAPTADAGPDQITDALASVTLDGTGSADTDGEITTFAWSAPDADLALSGADTATPSFTAPDVAEQTELRLVLTVTDNEGATASDETTVTVRPNQPPVADAGADQADDEGETVLLSAAASSDPDGDELTGFAWTQTDGPAVELTGADTAVASFTAPDVDADTVLTFSVTVTDARGKSDRDTVTATVYDIPVGKLRVGASKVSIVPTQQHIDGIEETRAGGTTHLQKFNLGGFGIDPTQNFPDPFGSFGDTLTEPASERFHESDNHGIERTWIRALAMEQLNADDTVTQTVFLVVDAVGAGNVITGNLRAAVSAATGINPDNIVFGQTHTHAGADLQGLWGGVPQDWIQNVLYPAAVTASAEALDALEPAVLEISSGDMSKWNRYRRPQRTDPDADSDTLGTLLTARSNRTEQVIGTLLQFNAHPTSINEDPRVPHPDYILGAVDHLEATHPNSVSLYFNGPIADASASGPTTGDTPYDRVRSRGAGMATDALGFAVQRVVDSGLSIRHQEVILPVTNPLFVAAGALGAFNRYYNFSPVDARTIPGIGPMVADQLVNLPQATPTAQTLVTRVSVAGAAGGLDIVTIPGEATGTFGGFIRSLADPADHVMLLGLTQNSFGYIIPEEEFSYTDASGDAGLIVPFTGYEEFVSLGPLTAPLLRSQGYIPLFDAEASENVPDYLTACQADPASDDCIFNILGQRIDYIQRSYAQLCTENGAPAEFCGLLNPDTPLATPCRDAGLPEGVCAVLGADDDGAGGGSDADLVDDALGAAVAGCDMLDPAHCLMPFPSDHFTMTAPAGSPQSVALGGTGKRINFNPLGMPRNVVGKPIDPTEWNRNDGYSPGQLIMTYAPGLAANDDGTIDGAPPLTNIPASLDLGSSSVVVLDAETGQPHPVWAEIDLNAGLLFPAQGTPNPKPKQAALLIRPARNFEEGRRYVVVLKSLPAEAGGTLTAQQAFATCRDGRTSLLPPVAERCDALSADVFPVLESAGIGVAGNESLYLAWDFTVASAQNNIARLRHMRDDAFLNHLGQTEDEAGNITDLGVAPTFTVDRVTARPYGDSESRRIARRIEGTLTIPSYVTPADPAPVGNVAFELEGLCDTLPQADLADGCKEVVRIADGGSVPPNRLAYDPSDGFNPADPAGSRFGDGLPDSTGTMTTRFTCQIPEAAAADAPARPGVYGHGLLDGHQAVTYDGVPEFSSDHNMLFCGVDLFGFATGDVPNVLSVLVDLSNFQVIPDGSQQGLLNFMFLGRALRHPDGFAAHPAFQDGDGNPLFSNTEVFYDGNSQGGISGGPVVALSKDITRGVLGVVGMNYSTLLRRSVDFDGEFEAGGLPPYALPLYLAYPDDLDRDIGFSLMQMLWDRSENNGYAHHMTDNATLNGPDNQLLLHPAFADHQVTHWSAQVMARTIGTQVSDLYFRRPGSGKPFSFTSRAEFFSQRDPDTAFFWDIPLVGRDAGASYDDAACLTDCRSAKSAYIEFDEGETATPPIGNVPPRADDFDPHGYPRDTDFGQCQKSHFLHPQGRIIDVNNNRIVTSPATCPPLPAVDLGTPGDGGEPGDGGDVPGFTEADCVEAGSQIDEDAAAAFCSTVFALGAPDVPGFIDDVSQCGFDESGPNCAFAAGFDNLGGDSLGLLLAMLAEQCAAAGDDVCAAINDGLPDVLPALSRPLSRGALDVIATTTTSPTFKTVDGLIDDWAGASSRIGGTQHVHSGEHIYTDFIFDARGADDGDDARRLALLGPVIEINDRARRIDQLEQAVGDQLGVPRPVGAQDSYGDRDLAANGDLHELRLAVDGDDLAVLATLVNLTDPAAADLLLLADTGAGPNDPADIGFGLSTRSFDLAIRLQASGVTAWNIASGEPVALDAAAAVSADTNAIEAKIPMGALTGDGVLRLAAVTLDGGVPANVAYRFGEPIAGVYNEQSQALALRAGTIDGFVNLIDAAELADGLTQTVRPSSGYHERHFLSAANISTESGENGRLQHYGLYIPSTYDGSEPVGINYWLHYRGGKGHSGGAWTPRLIRQLGEDYGNVVATPRGRGTSSWYTTDAHQDVFEVIMDVEGLDTSDRAPTVDAQTGLAGALALNIDGARRYVSGYSMGGFGTYLFGLLYPDFFAAGYSTAGPATQGAWTGVGPDEDLCAEEFEGGGETASACFIQANGGDANAQLNFRILENARNLPLAIHHGSNDELVPVTGVERVATRLTELGYRSDYLRFPGYEHFSQAAVDEWVEGARYLQRFTINPNPRTVTYKVVPALVDALNTVNPDPASATFAYNPDGAYWVDELVVRDVDPDSPRDTSVTGLIEATSRALAGDEVLTVPQSGIWPDAPAPSSPVVAPGHSTPFIRSGLEWLPTGPAAIANGFAATLAGLDAATLDVARMALDVGQQIDGSVTTDGPAVLTLAGIAAPVDIYVDGEIALTAVSGRAAFDLAEGGHVVTLVPTGTDPQTAPPPGDDPVTACLTDPSSEACPLKPVADLLGDGIEPCITDPTSEACPISPALGPLAGVLPTLQACSASLMADDCPVDELLAALREQYTDPPTYCTADQRGAFEHYIGAMHEHSGYSDGAIGTEPADYFAAGRAAGLDFMASADHSDNIGIPITANTDCASEQLPECVNVSEDNPTGGFTKWQTTADQAAAATDASFTAIRGFEWTSDRFGHINVFGSANYLNAKTSTGYALHMDDFWQWFTLPADISAGMGYGFGDDGLAVFNHPGREDAVHQYIDDPAYTFNGLRNVPAANDRVVGIEVFGKGDYYDDGGPSSSGGSWYAFALDNGWHLGPVGSEDHHDTDWAAGDLPKTVMIARNRGRDALLEAMRARRFYAVAQDYNHVRMTFAGNDSPMGSRMAVDPGAAVDFTATVTGVAQPRWEVIGPGGIVTLSAQGQALDFAVTVTEAEESWRFVRVIDEASGRVVAISAPVWFRTGTPYTVCDNDIPSDRDGDGVPDDEDAFPDNPNESADDDGDGTGNNADPDDDNDGVDDGADACPATPAGKPVDGQGCSASQRDSDGDGVNDEADQCPNTADGASANADGCSPAQLQSASCDADTGLDGGRSYQVILDSDVGGQISFQVLEPTEFDCGTLGAHPLLLQGHGFGGSRSTSGFNSYRNAGFAVISIDQRGFGASSGPITVMDPDAEGRDLIRILDWAEANLDYLAWRDKATGATIARPDEPISSPSGPNLVVGATGGSYGGGYQLLILGTDPKQRLDALAPDITWHDLRYSLNPGDTIKTLWDVALVAAGEASSYSAGLSNGQTPETRGLSPFIKETLARGGATNEFPRQALDDFRYNSLSHWCEAAGLPTMPYPAYGEDAVPMVNASNAPDGFPADYRLQGDVSVLLTQGMPDTLFNFNEAWWNLQCLQAAGASVQLQTHTGGHALPYAQAPEGPQTPVGGAGCPVDETAWMSAHLLPGGGDNPVSHDICFVLGDGDLAYIDRFDVLAPQPMLDAGEQGAFTRAQVATAAPVPNGYFAQSQAQGVVPVPVALGVAQADTVLAGIGRLDVTVATPTGANEAAQDCSAPTVPTVRAGCDSIVFAGLGVQRAGAPNYELIDDQIQPIRGLGDHSLDLIGVAERLGPGDTLALLLYGAHSQYPVSFSRDVTIPAVTVNGTVDLPLYATDADGNPVPGFPVSFSPMAEGGLPIDQAAFQRAVELLAQGDLQGASNAVLTGLTQSGADALRTVMQALGEAAGVALPDPQPKPEPVAHTPSRLSAGIAEGEIRVPIGTPLGGYLRPPVGGDYFPAAEAFGAGDPGPFFDELLDFVPEMADACDPEHPETCPPLSPVPDELRAIHSPYATYSPPSRGVYDSLIAKAVALHDGQDYVVLVKTDFIGMLDEVVQDVKAVVADRVGIDLGDGLIMSATHSHGGPGAIANHSIRYFWLAMDVYQPAVYRDVIDQLADVVVRAVQPDNLVAARIGHNSGAETRGLNGYRRGRLDGYDEVAGDALRRRLGVLRVDRVDTGEPMAVVINWAAHGIAFDVENLFFSGDVLGAVERETEALMNVPLAMLVQSVGGDVSPRGIGIDHKLQRIETYGKRLAPQVKALADAVTNFQDAPDLRAVSQRVILDRDRLGYAPEEYPYPWGAGQCGNDIAVPFVGGGVNDIPGYDATGLPTQIPYCLFSPPPDPVDLADNGVAENGAFYPQDTILSAARIGDITLLVQPGEPLVNYGVRLTEMARDEQFALDDTFVWGYSGDHIGYILPPVREDWATLGGAESTTTFWGWKQGQRFLDVSRELLVALRDGTPAPTDEFTVDYSLYQPYYDNTPPAIPLLSVAPATVFDQPDDLGRFQTTRFVFEGGDPVVDAPVVRLERLAGPGDWQVARRPNGEPIDSFFEMHLEYRLVSGRHAYSVVFEVPKDWPLGVYRFAAEGETGGFVSAQPYAATSNAFSVTAGPLVVEQQAGFDQACNFRVAYNAYPDNYRVVDAELNDETQQAPVRQFGSVRATTDAAAAQTRIEPLQAGDPPTSCVTVLGSGVQSVTVTDVFGNTGTWTAEPMEDPVAEIDRGQGLLGAIADAGADTNAVLTALLDANPEQAAGSTQTAIENLGDALADGVDNFDPERPGETGVGTDGELDEAARQALATAREAAPVVVTGDQLPGWSVPAAHGVANPYPSGAATTGALFDAFEGGPFPGHVRDAHNGQILYPLEGAPGSVGLVDVATIAAYRYDAGTDTFVEIPVQVDERAPYFLANANSDFSTYSGTDPELSYVWDNGDNAHTEGVESWMMVAGTCQRAYPDGLSAVPDPVAGLDDDDEIVFMASDAGSVYTGTQYPADWDAVQQVSVIDPLRPDATQFVYLVSREGGSSFGVDTGYVNYQRDADADDWADRNLWRSDDPEKLGTSNTGYGANLSGTVCVTDLADYYGDDSQCALNLSGQFVCPSNDRFPRDGITVTTDTYRFQASGRWMLRDLRVAPEDGSVADPYAWESRPDLLDRWKGRAFQQSPDSVISLVGFEDEQVNWEANSSLIGERCGPVRCIREVWGADSGTNVTKTETFYRDAVSYHYRVRVHPIPSDGLYTSWDYNRGAMVPTDAERDAGVEEGRYYTMLRPQGVPIDGINDDFGNVDGYAPIPLAQCIGDGGPQAPASNGRCPAFFDAADPTFNLPLAFDNWEQVSGKGDAGSLVYSFELVGLTSLANPLVVPYYRDDACLDDGTGDDPVARPFPGESYDWNGGLVRDAYDAGAGRALDHTGGTFDDCLERQGAHGSHGVHYFVTHDTDNAFTPLTTTEIDARQWQYVVPTRSPRNVGEPYANNVRVPLKTVAAPLSAPPTGGGQPPGGEDPPNANDTAQAVLAQVQAACDADGPEAFCATLAVLTGAVGLTADQVLTTLAAECQGAAAEQAVCQLIADPSAGDGIARAGAAVMDASWHMGASAGQFSATGVGIDGQRGYDPYNHSTRKVGSDTLADRITTRALVVEGANGKRVAVATNDLYLPNDLLRRRLAQLLAEHDAKAVATGGTVTGITEANLAMTVSHSHASPFYSTPAFGTWLFQDVFDVRFYDYMARQMRDAIVAAAEDMRAVRMGGTAVYANDVRGHTYGPKLSFEQRTDNTPAGQPYDYTSRQMYVLRFDDAATGDNYANWVVLGIHPEWVWGEEVISGDLTHATMRLLDRETGAINIMSQSETGTSGPHKDERAHFGHERHEYQEAAFAGAHRAARKAADNVQGALNNIAGDIAWDPHQHAPMRDDFPVEFAFQRFAPPVTRPIPGVSNCNSDRLFYDANPGVPAAGLPDCEHVAGDVRDGLEEGEPLYEPFQDSLFEIFPTPPETYDQVREALASVTGGLADQLAELGVPVPVSYSATAFGLVEEQATVPVQAFKLGDVGVTFCPCEQFTDPALNVISRLNRVDGDIHTGWDWDLGYAADNPLRNPANNGDFFHGDDEVGCTTNGDTVTCPDPRRGNTGVLTMTRTAFDRMKAQIHNDAAGWDDALVLDDGSGNVWTPLHAEAESLDPAQIKGNFTHEEHTEHGYGLVIPVGMANDYWGYMPAYREYRAHDHYRKALAALGPHGADFLATRMSRLAASLNGGEGMIPSALDRAYVAESGRAETLARVLGDLGRAATAIYDITQPTDGGTAEIREQPKDIEYFDAATVQWVGGATWLGMPEVIVQRLEDEQWVTVGDQTGEVAIHVDFLGAAQQFRGEDFDQGDFQGLVIPDPQDFANWRAGRFEWIWTAAYEGFASEVPVTDADATARPDTAYATPPGTYRFVIAGERQALPGREEYVLESDPFEITPWGGITVAQHGTNAGTVIFDLGPSTVHDTFQSGADTRDPTDRFGTRTVGPIDYPDTWQAIRDGGEAPIPWVRNERNLYTYRFSDDEQYCHRCTFRPWIDTGVAEAVTVSIGEQGQSTTVQATSVDGLAWQAPVGSRAAWIAPGGIVDAFGNTNRACIDLVGNECAAQGG